MTEIGRLEGVPPREAWPREAGDFTPWLAKNLDRLSEAIGVPLELEGTEVAVESFSADILARNLADGSLILIENQLEMTDHGHLGQIMTYLAGLDVKTVIWIAKDFREPHLSAIRWLNQHTVDPFAFFAIRLRVVRIGESLPAPIFDVLERPNEWERRLQMVAKEQSEVGETGQFRRDFWAAYREQFPEDVPNGVPRGGSNWWWPIGHSGLLLSIYVSVKEVGLFARLDLTADERKVSELIERHRAALEKRFDINLGDLESLAPLSDRKICDMRDRQNWPVAMAWMHETAHRYHRGIMEELGIEG